MHSATDTSTSLPVSSEVADSSVSVRVDEITDRPSAVAAYIEQRRAEQPTLLAEELGDYAREVDDHIAHNSRPADTAYGRAHLGDVGWGRQAVTR